MKKLIQIIFIIDDADVSFAQIHQQIVLPILGLGPKRINLLELSRIISGKQNATFHYSLLV